MTPTLIRVLSTGRTGTKFVAELLATLGYTAFHEGLYAGEPSAAVEAPARFRGASVGLPTAEAFVVVRETIPARR